MPLRHSPTEAQTALKRAPLKASKNHHPARRHGSSHTAAANAARQIPLDVDTLDLDLGGAPPP
jgi:hypothetical protein